MNKQIKLTKIQHKVLRTINSLYESNHSNMVSVFNHISKITSKKNYDTVMQYLVDYNLINAVECSYTNSSGHYLDYDWYVTDLGKMYL